MISFLQWFAAIHIGLICSTYWCLLLNGFVGFQFAEDGTPLSLWVKYIYIYIYKNVGVVLTFYMYSLSVLVHLFGSLLLVSSLSVHSKVLQVFHIKTKQGYGFFISS